MGTMQFNRGLNRVLENQIGRWRRRVHAPVHEDALAHHGGELRGGCEQREQLRAVRGGEPCSGRRQRPGTQTPIQLGVSVRFQAGSMEIITGVRELPYNSMRIQYGFQHGPHILMRVSYRSLKSNSGFKRLPRRRAHLQNPRARSSTRRSSASITTVAPSHSENTNLFAPPPAWVFK
jgi:hypothetical protein